MSDLVWLNTLEGLNCLPAGYINGLSAKNAVVFLYPLNFSSKFNPVLFAYSPN
jgi:hypothetical protein